MLSWYQLTDEQRAILSAVGAGHRLVKVNALAGTGKTSTTEWIARVPCSGMQLYSTFNITAGQDAARRFAANPLVDVIRPGQLAWRAFRGSWQQVRADE